MERDKEDKKPFFPETLLLGFILVFFNLVLGFLAAVRLNKFFFKEEALNGFISLWQILFSFVVVTVLFLFFFFFFKSRKSKEWIYKIIFLFSSSFGSLLFFELWLPFFLALLLVLFFAFFWQKEKNIFFHDLIFIFGIAGIGSNLGSRMDSLTVIAVLILFSIYDVIAVLKTRHMVKMAKEMLEYQAVLALIIPSKISFFKEKLKNIKTESNFLILGGGDIAFPIIFSASLLAESVFRSLLVIVFSLFGFLFNFFILYKRGKKPIPALPLISFFSIIGYLISFLIK